MFTGNNPEITRMYLFKEFLFESWLRNLAELHTILNLNLNPSATMLILKHF